MKRRKSLVLDAVIWAGLMVLAAVVAFNLLQRDKQRSFGAVAFGSLPEFRLQTPEGAVFDRRQIKGYVWAVHTAALSDDAMALARQLVIVQQQTGSGKRHLNILTVAASGWVNLKPFTPFHYIIGGPQEEIDRIFSAAGRLKKNSILLIDQNSVIRGRYEFDNVDDYRAFQRDLMRIL